MIRALFSYGSTLSPLTRAGDSVPDRFVLVDDVPETLCALGHPRLARLAPRLIPPITIADGGAKLSLISVAEAERELNAPRDLYLAGRLSKRIEIHIGDADDLIERAIDRVVETAALGLGRVVPLEDALYRCLAISYLAEIRPERPDKPRRLFDAFPEFYRARFLPRLTAHARARGIVVEDDRLYDARPDEARAREKRELDDFLTRARLRSMLRWPQQLAIYRGSFGYVAAKLRRVTIGG